MDKLGVDKAVIGGMSMGAGRSRLVERRRRVAPRRKVRCDDQDAAAPHADRQKPVVDCIETVGKQASKDGALGAAMVLANRPDAGSELGKIDAPTLVLVGQNDPVYVFETPVHLAAAIAEWGKGMKK